MHSTIGENRQNRVKLGSEEVSVCPIVAYTYTELRRCS